MIRTDLEDCESLRQGNQRSGSMAMYLEGVAAVNAIRIAPLYRIESALCQQRGKTMSVEPHLVKESDTCCVWKCVALYQLI